MTDAIRILGIDPGLRNTGWGVIEQAGSRLSHIANGVIRVDPNLSLAARLGGIHREISDLANAYWPTCAGVEETLVNANPRSALKLGQARGAALAALHSAGLSVHEYSPRTIKLAVVGTGGADKTQVAFMVSRLLPTAGKLASDASDALACAICTAHHVTTRARGAA